MSKFGVGDHVKTVGNSICYNGFDVSRLTGQVVAVSVWLRGLGRTYKVKWDVFGGQSTVAEGYLVKVVS